jgi:hypothetical protein
MPSAITTVSLAVGGLVPFCTPAGDIIVTQAHAWARDGHVMLQAMLAGDRADDAMARMKAADAHRLHGPRLPPWAGDIVDGDVIVPGNAPLRDKPAPVASSIVTSEAEQLQKGETFVEPPSRFRWSLATGYVGYGINDLPICCAAANSCNGPIPDTHHAIRYVHEL